MAKKSDSAYDFIKQKIISGEFPPKMPINEADLVQELGTSRTPVREALLRLRELGFIDIYANRATVVSEISIDLIENLYEVRFLNESTLNINASKNIDPKILEEFREGFAHPDPALDDEKRQEFLIGLDDRLHAALQEACSNPFISKMMYAVYEHNRRMRRFSTNRISVPLHLSLIDAILSKDEDRIHQATIDHLIGSRDCTLASYERGDLKYIRKALRSL